MHLTKTKSLYITQHCPRTITKKTDKNETKSDEIKCVKVGDHYDLMLEGGKTLRIYTGAAKKTIKLVPSADYQGFRAATNDEILDQTQPKVSALLCGMGIGEDKISTEFLFSAVLSSLNNLPAITQILSLTTSPKLEVNTGEVSKIFVEQQDQMPNNYAKHGLRRIS